jgi:uncharacterized membrane-anchored protein YhcB (DUF1043 family)
MQNRTVDWVQHDIKSDGWSWRQKHPETGLGDRRLNHQIDGAPRYTKNQQQALKAAFSSLVATLKKEYNAVWWHYSNSTRQLFFDDGSGRQEITKRALKKEASDAFEKFAKTLSKYHNHKIIPGRE